MFHLEQGETRLVQELTEEMLWIFEDQKLHREALAALGLFCHAARAGEVQAEWTRRLVKFLYRPGETAPPRAGGGSPARLSTGEAATQVATRFLALCLPCLEPYIKILGGER